MCEIRVESNIYAIKILLLKKWNSTYSPTLAHSFTNERQRGKKQWNHDKKKAELFYVSALYSDLFRVYKNCEYKMENEKIRPQSAMENEFYSNDFNVTIKKDVNLKKKID